MGGFYEKLADVYEDIFPLSAAQVDFVLRNLSAPPAKVVDLGCSSGALARELARVGYDVLGIDLSSRMVSQAQSAAATLDVHGSARFQVADMRDTVRAERGVDGLLCLGNTLVHLTEQADLQEFLDNAYQALVPRGRFIVQIVNYDRVEAQQVRELPAISGRSGNKLERYYSSRPDGLVDFNTVLTLADGSSHESNVALQPLLKTELTQMLKQAGFHTLDFFGSYQGASWTVDSFHTICSAQKL